MKYIKKFENNNITTSNCREENGITIGLIDSIISIGRILKDRLGDNIDDNVMGALKDLQSDEDIKFILKYK